MNQRFDYVKNASGAYKALNSTLTHEYTFRADGSFTRGGAQDEAGQGRYRIEGFTIELTFTDPRRERHLFAVYRKAGGQPQVLSVGDYVFGTR